MNKVSIIICILPLCFIGIVNAQNGGNQQENQPTKGSGTEQKADSMFTCEIKANLQMVATALNMKMLKNEIKNQSVVIVFGKDTQTLFLSIDTIKVKLSEIEKRLNDKGYNLLMPETKMVKKMVEAIPAPPDEKYNPQIDKFLNLEDTTIFTSRFIIYNLQEIHPSRRDYYQMVQKIHNFGETLKRIENSLSNSKINEVAKQINIPTEAAKKSLLEAAKIDIAKAEHDLDELRPFGKELDLLSPSQSQYYKALKDKFNDLYSKIYPD